MWSISCEVSSHFGATPKWSEPSARSIRSAGDMSDPPPEGDGHYTYLMQFMDGNRIDLSFYALEQVELIVKDSLSLVLLDKENLIRKLPPPSEASYLPQQPTAKAFDDCCNEFWWLNPYVAKGLWRDELIYARYMFDTHMREQLLKMLRWYFGMQTNFQKSPGKLGKHLKGQLDTEPGATGTYHLITVDRTGALSAWITFRQIAKSWLIAGFITRSRMTCVSPTM
jgi:hypothetical protein